MGGEWVYHERIRRCLGGGATVELVLLRRRSKEDDSLIEPRMRQREGSDMMLLSRYL